MSGGKLKGSIENELTDGVKIVINGDVLNGVLDSAVAGMEETIGETQVRPLKSFDCPQRPAAKGFPWAIKTASPAVVALHATMDLLLRRTLSQ